jgi:hypothetical protein
MGDAVGAGGTGGRNRVCLVAATQPTAVGNSAIMTLHNDFTIMTPWAERPFDGHMSHLIITHAPIHLVVTQNKVLMMSR